MIELRASNARGTGDHGWLKSRFSFSFSHYFDRKFMGFGPLRVINEDHIAAQQGFSAHPHDNMEIITYIIEGSLEHKDSMGHSSIIRDGMIQKMSAGSGIVHSEYSAEKKGNTHLLQIWIKPNKQNIAPNYEEYIYEGVPNRLECIASYDKAQKGAWVCQDLKLYRGFFTQKAHINFKPEFSKQWLQLIEGAITVGDIVMQTGDGIAIEALSQFDLEVNTPQTHFLLFDMKD